jgi:hypothetical protein
MTQHTKDIAGIFVGILLAAEAIYLGVLLMELVGK